MRRLRVFFHYQQTAPVNVKVGIGWHSRRGKECSVWGVKILAQVVDMLLGKRQGWLIVQHWYARTRPWGTTPPSLSYQPTGFFVLAGRSLLARKTEGQK